MNDIKNINLTVLGSKLGHMGIFRACDKIQNILDIAIKQMDLPLALYLLNELEFYVPRNISKYIFYEQTIATTFDQVMKQNQMLEYKFIAATNDICSNVNSLRDTYKGSECVILGNDTTVSLTKEETSGRCVIGCLPVYEDCNGQSLTPDLCVGIQDALPDTPASEQLNETAYILPLGFRGAAYSKNKVFFVNMLPSSWSSHMPPLFSIDLERRAWVGSGQAYLALQLACYLGCSELHVHCAMPKAELARAAVALRHHSVFYSSALPTNQIYASENNMNGMASSHIGGTIGGGNSTPDISIVVACYNAEATLDRCLASCVNQHVQFEVIVVNDGSTDASLAVAHRWELTYDVKVITQSNQGPGMAKNTGIRAARGRYITFVDSDDYLDLGTLEKCLWELRQRPVDILLFGMKRIHNGKKIAQTENFTLRTGIEGLRIMVNKEPLAAWGRIYSRELLINNDIRFGVGPHDDLVFTLQCYYYAKCCSSLPLYGYNWVTRGGSIMASSSPKHLHYIEHNMNEIRNFMQRENIYKKYYPVYNYFAYRYFNDVYARCKSYNFTDQELIKESNSIIYISINKHNQTS